MVDPTAWAMLKRAALEAGRTLAGLVAELIVDELSHAEQAATRTSPGSRRRRSPGGGSPRPGRRVVRLDCDDDVWHRVRLLADDVGLSLGRYLGEIIEAAAFNRGWRANVKASRLAAQPRAGGSGARSAHVGAIPEYADRQI